MNAPTLHDNEHELIAKIAGSLDTISGGGGTPPTGFDPNTITGLVLWIDSDHTIGGPTVGAMTDLSTGGHTIESAESNTPTLVPNSLKGHPSVQFNSNSRLDVNPFLPNDACTVFAVCAANSATCPVFATILLAQNFRVCARVSTSQAWGTFLGGGDMPGTTIMNGGVYHLLEMISLGIGGGLTTLMVNGEIESTTTFDSKGSGGTHIGNEPSQSRHLDGNIVAILVYDRGLSDAERDEVRNWLLGKYF